MYGAILPVHRVGFDVDRGAYVMALRDVFEIVIKQVTIGSRLDVPQVVVGVDDGDLWHKRRLTRCLGQPVRNFICIADDISGVRFGHHCFQLLYKSIGLKPV